jgi:hypothetical protein
LRFRSVFAVAALLCVANGPAALASQHGVEPEMIEFEQICDASAVVFTLGGGLLVADERRDVLRTYATTGGKAIAAHDLYGLTGTPKRARRNFSAFEGAARLGDKIYFITSHAREEKGKNRPNRRRLLALQSDSLLTAEKIEPTGIAYTDLRAQMSTAPELRSVALGSSIMELHRQIPYLAPQLNGLNIEGLAAGKDGTSLMLGLRGPIRGERAILIPVSNPERVILGFADPKFGLPITLDLGGLGIASIALHPQQGVYYIVAGRKDAPGETRLYRWSGEADEAPVLVQDILPADFAAQGLAVSPDGQRLMVLSDDGDTRVSVEDKEDCQVKVADDGTCPCNRLTTPASMRFRGQWIDLVPAPTAREQPPSATP